jgi:hypothetical protein
MPDAGSRAWPWWAFVALTVYTALLVSLAFPLSKQINPDGVAYLRIAGYYLSGDLGKAVSGYWSPLYSWLLIPWLAAGVPGLWRRSSSVLSSHCSGSSGWPALVAAIWRAASCGHL